MKILILSVTAGEGHNSTAKAMREVFESFGASCTVLDTFQYVSPAMAKFLSDGYLLVTEKAKTAYAAGYRLAEKRKKGHDWTEPFLVNMTLAQDIADYINKDDYAVIVYTHPFAGMICDLLKQKSMITEPTVGILTDFTFHPYWENNIHNDYVITPDQALLLQGRYKGFRDEQIKPLGIPIHPKFAQSAPQNEARSQLGLERDVTTILIMGGSMGYGNMADTVRRLDTIPMEMPYQLIAVCGNNQSAKAEIDGMIANSELRHRVMATGFVDYVPLLMDASDCIVTKPGGLTTSESLAKGLPMVIVNPIPGQEMRNTEFLLNNGAACAASKTCQIEECLFQLLSSPRRLAAMKECVRALGKPHSTEDVCRFVLSLGAVHSLPAEQEI